MQQIEQAPSSFTLAEAEITQEAQQKGGVPVPNFSKHINLVEGRYSISTENPLVELCSDFATAYPVIDQKAPHARELYALTFKKNLPVRMGIINTLRSRMYNHLVTPIAIEVATISSYGDEEQLYTIILEKPHGTPLRQLLHEHKHFQEEFVIKYIIFPIAKLLEQLESSGLAHGTINLDTVLLDDKNHLTVAECISTPSGYFQPPLFETAERGMMLPIAKGEASIAHDLYALGTLVCQLLSPTLSGQGMENEDIIMSKITLGTYNTFKQKLNLSPAMTDLLIGLLNDSQKDCWDSSHVMTWLKGKNYNLLPPQNLQTARRSIIFLNRTHTNLRSLAYDLFLNWNEAKKFLREDTLARWIETSIDTASLAKQIRHINKVTTIAKNHPHFDNNDELVARTILVLDPKGPLRIQNYALDLHALGLMVAYGYATNNNTLIQLTGIILTSGLIDIWMSHRSNDADPTIGWLLDKASIYSTKKGLGFGMERCLYELNPLLTCQSSLIKKDYILTLKMLLQSIDAITPSLESHTELVDRHIAAFIANRMKLTNEVRMKGLSRFPDFAENRHIQSLALLGLAQRKSHLKKLKYISEHISNQLLSLVDLLHSKEIKKNLHDDITRLSKDGNLIHLLRQVSNPQYLAKDKVGFREAKKKYKKLYNRKRLLANNSAIDNTGYRYGLQMSVIIAYLLCAVEILYLVATNM